MGSTWGPSGADRTQMGPMLAPWASLSGWLRPCRSVVSSSIALWAFEQLVYKQSCDIQWSQPLKCILFTVVNLCRHTTHACPGLHASLHARKHTYRQICILEWSLADGCLHCNDISWEPLPHCCGLLCGDVELLCFFVDLSKYSCLFSRRVDDVSRDVRCYSYTLAWQ